MRRLTNEDTINESAEHVICYMKFGRWYAEKVVAEEPSTYTCEPYAPTEQFFSETHTKRTHSSLLNLFLSFDSCAVYECETSEEVLAIKNNIIQHNDPEGPLQVSA